MFVRERRPWPEHCTRVATRVMMSAHKRYYIETSEQSPQYRVRPRRCAHVIGTLSRVVVVSQFFKVGMVVVSVCLSVCLSGCLSFCLCLCLSACPSGEGPGHWARRVVCLSVCLSIRLSLCLSVCLLYVFSLSLCLFHCLSVCVFVCLVVSSVCLFVCVSAVRPYRLCFCSVVIIGDRLSSVELGARDMQGCLGPH